MNFASKLLQLIAISLIVFIASILFIISPVSANNIPAGFGAGTKIATPNGEVVVENLKTGDRILGYNFETHQPETNIVVGTNHKSSFSYYLINNRAKITGTSSVYVKSTDNPKIINVQQLQSNQKLFSQNHASILMRSITQVVKPTEIYQIYLDNPIGNIFADDLLIHDGERLPKLFRKQYGTCNYNSSGWFYDSSSYNYTKCENINSDNLPDYLKAFAIFIIGTYVIGTAITKLIIYVRNLIRFSGKQFTKNQDLIDFTKSINSKFTNKYSLRYLEGYKVWKMIALQPELNPEQYQQLITREQLLERVGNLFEQYNQDLVARNFDNIRNYFPKFFDQQKYAIYFQNRQYIIYRPKIIETAIIDFKAEADNINIFKVQINAEMMNFAISEPGYVLTGDSELKQYSEYWEIEVTPEGNCLIKAINDTLTTRIMEGDLRAKQEAYGDNMISG